MNIKGFVYECTDDRLFPVKGLPNVAVSNGKEVVLTDSKGCFSLPAPERGFVFVIKPSGYRLPPDRFNQPQYYHPYFPEGTPAHLELDYPGLEPEGDLEKEYNFFLIPEKGQQQFSAIIMGDIQPRNETDVAYFRDLVARALAHRQADFLLPLGDLTWDDLSLYPVLKDTLSTIGMPFFPVCGNHDINLKSPNKAFATETFKRYFGPAYYAFNHGQVHFVVLEDIGYSGWDEVQDCKGIIQGWIDQEQLDWLEEDLRHVPDDYLIIIASHIPIYTDTAAENTYRNVQNRASLFEVLKDRRKLFAVSAHTHCIEHADLSKGGWDGDVPFRSLIAGAACGAWWKGPLDLNGLPVCLGMDGSPNGFFTFHFDGPSFQADFCPVGQMECYQMGIRYPAGDIPEASQLESPVIVNVYNASPEAEVFFILNGKDRYPMERVVGPDPFVEYFLEKHKDAYPEWMKARITAHLWVAQWPQQLAAGIHVIEVRAEEKDQRVWISKQSFRILTTMENEQEEGAIFRQQSLFSALDQ